MSAPGRRLKCKAHKSDGSPCKNWAMNGLGVCRFHGGATTHSRQAAQRRLAEEAARSALRKLDIQPRELEPVEALLEELYRGAGWVRFLEQEVATLPLHAGGDRVEGITQPGLIAWDHSGDQAAHLLYKLLADERERLAKTAKMAIEAGVAERAVRIAERQGALIAELITRILDDPELDLAADQRRRGRQIAARHIRVLEDDDAA